ncbi:mitochondrial ribosomal death-associated protein 3-domain-containing protein [Phlyctochytrium arcticum]|nr:mitochondrial ribosomal death-associated protein 3-domain-containing protein [Phlyctochytrium arcticum]
MLRSSWRCASRGRVSALQRASQIGPKVLSSVGRAQTLHTTSTTLREEELRGDSKLHIEPLGESLDLGEWVPQKAVKTNVGEVLRIPNDLTDAISKDSFSRTVASHPQFAFMLRQTTLDLIQKITSSSKASSTPVIIDGPRGAGKSVALLQLASHFRKQGWITMYIPKTTVWTDGTQPFALVKDTKLYEQPELVSGLLTQFLALNKDLSSIKTTNGQTLKDLANEGIKNSARAHKALEEIVNTLLAQKDKPFLLAIDQINTFYSKTAYRDTESQPILATSLSIVNFFNNILTSPQKAINSAIVGAKDYSDTYIQAPLFNAITAEQSRASSSTKTTTNLNSSEEPIPETSPYGALLPKTLSPETYDPYTSSIKTIPQKFQVWELPPYNLFEIASALHFYQNAGVLREEKLNRPLIEKFLAVTGGNALKVYRRAAASI